MTDEELIARLRDVPADGLGTENLCLEAADRIEAMTDEEQIDYTNPDTIARQNIAPNAGCDIDGTFYDVRNLVHLASSQADRIEALTAKVKLMDDLDAINGEKIEALIAEQSNLVVAAHREGYDQARAVSSELRRAMAERIMEHEANLAKAVEALSFASNMDATDWSETLDVKNQARATLAEIKGK